MPRTTLRLDEIDHADIGRIAKTVGKSKSAIFRAALNAQDELQQARESIVDLEQHWEAAEIGLREAREEIARLKEALTSVHADHTRSLSSGTGKITECTCRTCQALHPVPEKPKDNA